MQAKITKRRVEAMKPGELLADDEVSGFVARCLPSGAAVYGFRYRERKGGKRRWDSLGRHGSITPEQARDLAKKRAGEVADGRDPLGERQQSRITAAKAKAAQEATVSAVLDDFVGRHVRKNKLRSGDEIERVINRYVKPQIGSLSIYEVRRSHITKMLDAIEDSGAPVMADRTLAHVRKAFGWYASRDDLFNSPIVRGMARTKPKERARDRILSDDEIRDLWQALDKRASTFAAIVRLLLLTAQRRDEVASMRWTELDGDTWIIPADRYKTKAANLVPLSAAAKAILGTVERSGDLVFSTTGKTPFSGFSKAKRMLDASIAEIRKGEGREPMRPWVLHDLRRTARSLMSRAGVPSDVAERVLGHVIPGVRGVYDRHQYEAEKRNALKRLVALVERILSPSSDNVVNLRSAEAE